MTNVIDIAPRELAVDLSHVRDLAAAIYYPEKSNNPSIDKIILETISESISSALAQYFNGTNVASGLQLEDQLTSTIIESVDFDTLNTSLSEIVHSTRSQIIREKIKAEAVDRFETALKNSIDITVRAASLTQLAKQTGDFKKYQSQEKTFALFGCTLSDFKDDTVQITKQSRASVIATKAAAVGVAGVISVGLVNPVAAEENSTNNTISSVNSIAAVVPLLGNVSRQIISSEVPTTDAVEEVFEDLEPVIDFSDAEKVARGKHEKPKDENTAVNPLTGKEYKPKHLAEVDEFTVKEANQVANEVASGLEPGVKDAFERIEKAIDTKKLNDLAASDNDVFSPSDPFNEKKELVLPMSGKSLIAAKTQSQIIRSILANDQDIIAIFSQYYTDNPPSDTMLEIIESASGTTFAESGDDLTYEQKYLILLIMHDLQSELVKDANKVVDARQKAFNAAERKKQQSRDNVRTNNNSKAVGKITYYESEWDGEYKITPAILREINRWPLSKEGKKIAPLLIKNAVDNAEKNRINPGIASAKALMETGWFSDSLSRHHNNFYGIKAGSNYDGGTVTVSTKEDYGNGLITIKDSFRSHDTPAEGMQDYYDVTNHSIYQDAARLYLNPELNSYALLGELNKKGIIVGAQGQPGVRGWSTGEDVSYTEQVILAKYVSKVLPKHFLQGFDWSHETYSGSPVPKTIRGKIYFNQHDERWALDSYRRSDSPRNYNVSTSGCMPASLAIIVSNMTGKVVTPEDMVELSLQKGFRTKDSGTSDAMVSYVAKKYGLKVKLIQQNRNAFIDVLQNGGMIMASGKDTVRNTPGTTAGHIYTIDHVAIKGNSARFFTLDPNSTPKSFNNFSFNELSKDSNNGRDSLRLAWAFYK